VFLASGEERKNTEMKELEKPIQAWIWSGLGPIRNTM